jgi:aryl-alcohol dehydrogenase-like predicted oxidoreductase
VRVLRGAVHEHGITHIDTADAYGPHTAELLIREALHPYPSHLLIATKVGMVRPGPNIWKALGRPDYLRAAVEMSLRRLQLERIDLCYLHRIDPAIPAEDQLGELEELRAEGKVGHIGVSKVNLDQLRAAEAVEIAAVQNCLNLNEKSDPVLHHCQEREIPYIVYHPLNAGLLVQGGVRQALQ